MEEEKGGGASRTQCRLWWPKHILVADGPAQVMLLLGWAIPGFRNSIDIVVATSVSLEEADSHLTNNHLQAIIASTQTQMPMNLQECANVSIVGHCIFDPVCKNLQNNSKRTDNKIVIPNKSKEGLKTNTNSSITYIGCDQNGLWNNGNLLLKQYYQCRIRTSIWIELFCQTVSLPIKELRWIPELCNLHREGSLCSSDIHTVMYEPPRYGSHHFSYMSWSSLCEASNNCNGAKPSMRPNWMVELEQQLEPSNLDVVVLAMNSATAMQNMAQELLNSPRASCKQLYLISIMMVILRKMTAASMALIAVFFYASLQLISKILSKRAFSILNTNLLKLFRHISKNLHIRSRQLMHWPVFLLESGCRFQPNVAVAHRTALLKHSFWSAIAIDIFIGNVAGMLLLVHCEAIADWVLCFACGITDNILRSGCVWLMGVPAGFKLNTELSQTLGMVSLNIIQVWSALWFFVRPLLKPCIKVFAVCGIFLGFTIQAALFIDVILLATFHISMLHWLLALVYSHQIQALSALSRLFRGRKRNPLRARIDSFVYSVEQHVVGSLVFTPLLLLVPTTSVFYVFFTILNTVVSLACIGLQFLISGLHAFPYAEIAIWLVHPKRFPSGVWFKQIWTGSSQLSDAMSRYPAVEAVGQERKLRDTDEIVKKSAFQLSNAEMPNGQFSFGFLPGDSEIVVSSLGINSASLGEIISPHLHKTFKGLSLSSGASCVYRVFSGGRIPSSLEIGMPALMPWVSISFKEFWWITYEAVLACL
ncbi:uncharacterized protein LOC131053087 isoform X2 [Cryptomeria japonica]|uniref:uncharacterized protein LOC131053087 isoform X2 n=1 Tax=Cryptomeria japonica TaxID=3369 RepID=UPI0027DA7E58|nr:uncharacterized protein LOC131053087 isoform X2 [Cryptomeria japonica]